MKDSKFPRMDEILEAAEARAAKDADPAPNPDAVICPACTHQFRAVPVNVQAIQRRAEDLFDNRLGWSDGRQPYAPRELWADLGAALYGEGDPRVQELRGSADKGAVPLTVMQVLGEK